ncbi:MAG: HEPN domain-containing protein, partial [Hyphomicrobiales bacterium]
MIIRWEQGRAVIDDLLTKGRLDRVQPSGELAEEMLARADRHLRSAKTLGDSADVEGAFSLTYDAARLALAALLVNQGLRAKSGEGGHAVLLEVIHAQLQPPPDKIFTQFDWIRRMR